jgi:polar amino acid transport system substrate-binding protein
MMEEFTMLDRRQFVRGAAALSAGVVALPSIGIGAQSDGTPEAGTPEAGTPLVPVDISTLPLKNPGQLTIHTDQPVFPPWFIDNDPSNGQGFEGALAAAIAERLGFTLEQVEWGYTSFNASYAPGPKDFDFYITEVSITEERDRAVDFSDPYYNSPLTVVAAEGSPVAEASTLEELRTFTYATQVGTTWLTYILDVLQPESDPLVLDTTSDALTQLANGAVDAVVLDLETSIFVTTEQFEGLVIAGVLPGDPPGEGMGMVFEEGSELVPYVNSALASLIADGTRDALIEEWLPQPDELHQFSE